MTVIFISDSILSGHICGFAGALSRSHCLPEAKRRSLVNSCTQCFVQRSCIMRAACRAWQRRSFLSTRSISAVQRFVQRACIMHAACRAWQRRSFLSTRGISAVQCFVQRACIMHAACRAWQRHAFLSTRSISAVQCFVHRACIMHAACRAWHRHSFFVPAASQQCNALSSVLLCCESCVAHATCHV
jgi:hypothetical protein